MKRIKGIQSQPGQANTDGLLRVKVIDTFDVLAFHDPETYPDVAILMGTGPLPAGTLFLKPGASFKEILFPAYQATFSEKLLDAEVWASTLSIAVPKDSITVATELQLYRGRLFMAVILDGNENARLVGSPSYPLRVSIDTTTAKVALAFSGSTPTRSYFLPGYEDQQVLGQSDFNSDFSFDFAV